MNTNAIAHLEMLAEVDELTSRLTDWAQEDSPWEPLARSQSLVRRVLDRVDTLRIRLEAPLIVATFGGTGTGKSALVNALIGTECTISGRQRPTTRRTVLITHTETDVESLGLPLEDFEVVQRASDLLRDIVILDCPDPDTNESDTPGSNLERLHEVLPHCDVLIYTSTQQKYRSARIVEELGQAATGCRLVFVQTHAELDEDIRDDWRKHLSDRYEVPDVFYVDSLRALAEQRAGHRPSGDMGRLMDLLTRQLAASERTRVRRSNLLDLMHAALERCRDIVAGRWSEIAQLETALNEQQESLRQKMSARLHRELSQCRHLWERRILGAVTELWGMSPFSLVLRIYHGLGALVASTTLFRARSSAQMALVGALQGMRWLEGHKEQKSANAALQRAGTLGLDDALLRESQLIIAGHVHAAHLEDVWNKDVPAGGAGTRLRTLRSQAARMESEFIDDAQQRIDDVISDLAVRNSGVFVRMLYELLFLAYVVYVLYRMGRNFFYDSAVLNTPLLSTDFYIPAALFFLLWTGLLVILFTRRLRRGVQRRINTLAKELAEHRLAGGLFPELEAVCQSAHISRQRLEQLGEQVESLRRSLLRNAELGAPVLRNPSESLSTALPS